MASDLEANTAGGLLFGDVAANNQGAFLFFRSGLEVSGLYAGANPATDAVVLQGDEIAPGLFIDSVRASRHAFNDAGQAAFWAVLDNGTVAIVLATPIPKAVLVPFPGRIVNVSRSSLTNLTLSYTGQIGVAHYVQRSPDLLSWSNVSPLLNVTAGTNTFTDPGVLLEFARQYYRLFTP